MVIKASSGKAIDELLVDLTSGDPVRCDGAVARLTVIGPRAVQRLLGVGADHRATASTRVAAFRALEAIGDPRALGTALLAITETDTGVATAAIRVARTFLNAPKGVGVLDRLTAVAVDPLRPAAVRIEAIRALGALDPATVKPLLALLGRDPDPAVAVVATGAGARAKNTRQVDPNELLQDAARSGLPDDASLVRRALVGAGGEAPLTTLHQIVERARIREGAETRQARVAWTGVRAAAHVALAQRGSRLALYDLRETIESAKGPVAVEFLAALTAIGDPACLEPLATAYAQATVEGVAREDWWHRSLADAFAAIVEREGITRRHVVAKKVDKRWPGLFDALTTRGVPGATRRL